MAFCINCGYELAEEAKFCSNCGCAANNHSNEQRKIQYDGELHKCPNCGEIRKAFSANCESCGYEFQYVDNSSSIKLFADKIESATTEEQVIKLIKNYPIPNTKVDIYEYMIIAASNISFNATELLLDAWIVKLEQSYHKARLLIADDPGMLEIDALYKQTKKRIDKIKLGKTAHKTNVFVSKAAKKAGRSLVGNAAILPSLVVCTAWVISILVIIPLISGVNGEDYAPILFFDLIGGAVVIPLVARTYSTLPKLIVIVGLVISIAILIPLCSGIHSEDYQPILFFDIITTVVIIVRIYWKRTAKHPDKER